MSEEGKSVSFDWNAVDDADIRPRLSLFCYSIFPLPRVHHQLLKSWLPGVTSRPRPRSLYWMRVIKNETVMWTVSVNVFDENGNANANGSDEGVLTMTMVVVRPMWRSSMFLMVMLLLLSKMELQLNLKILFYFRGVRVMVDSQ
jgi:hypothetical protein